MDAVRLQFERDAIRACEGMEYPLFEVMDLKISAQIAELNNLLPNRPRIGTIFGLESSEVLKRIDAHDDLVATLKAIADGKYAEGEERQIAAHALAKAGAA